MVDKVIDIASREVAGVRPTQVHPTGCQSLLSLVNPCPTVNLSACVTERTVSANAHRQSGQPAITKWHRLDGARTQHLRQEPRCDTRTTFMYAWEAGLDMFQAGHHWQGIRLKEPASGPQPAFPLDQADSVLGIVETKKLDTFLIDVSPPL